MAEENVFIPPHKPPLSDDRQVNFRISEDDFAKLVRMSIKCGYGSKKKPGVSRLLRYMVEFCIEHSEEAE